MAITFNGNTKISNSQIIDSVEGNVSLVNGLTPANAGEFIKQARTLCQEYGYQDAKFSTLLSELEDAQDEPQKMVTIGKLTKYYGELKDALGNGATIVEAGKDAAIFLAKLGAFFFGLGAF